MMAVVWSTSLIDSPPASPTEFSVHEPEVTNGPGRSRSAGQRDDRGTSESFLRDRGRSRGAGAGVKIRRVGQQWNTRRPKTGRQSAGAWAARSPQRTGGFCERWKPRCGRGGAQRSQSHPTARGRRGRTHRPVERRARAALQHYGFSSSDRVASVQAPLASLDATAASTNFTPTAPSRSFGNWSASGSGFRPDRLAAIASAASE